MNREVSLSVLDRVSTDYDCDVKKEKDNVERLLSGSFGPGLKRRVALQEGIRGGTLFGDNVGKVLNIT